MKNTDSEFTNVVFRKFKDNSIIALFPQIIESNVNKFVLSYQHIGQHSSADYQHIINCTKLATELEYKELFNELTNSIGYKLKVLKRAKTSY